MNTISEPLAVDRPLGRLPRFALLTPYSGGNLGDAAIQDAMIAGLRLRSPIAEYSGISLNCDNFLERHGTVAFPLCTSARRFYGMSRGKVSAESDGEDERRENTPSSSGHVRKSVKRTSGLVQRLKKFCRWSLVVPKEFIHAVRGYRFLRRHDLLIVAGGGQLDEEWGGPWGHPFALFKWACLARFARVPCAIVSVGVGKLKSPFSRFFVFVALRLARYRSYRDVNTRNFAATLLKAADSDPVVPDLAFSLRISDGRNTSIRTLSQGRTIVAISPIAYGKPSSWPRQDRDTYGRYLQQMVQVLSDLTERDYFLVMVWSSLGDDEGVVPEILKRVKASSLTNPTTGIYTPRITNWKELISILSESDLLVASRLHSTIFGFLTGTPTVSISFDPKVNWLMNDLDQKDCLLQIQDFAANDVLDAIDRIQSNRAVRIDQIKSYQHRIFPEFNEQFDALIRLANGRQGCRNPNTQWTPGPSLAS